MKVLIAAILAGGWSAGMAMPASAVILSKVAEPETAPPDTLTPAHRTYKEAIELTRKSADRTVKTFEPQVLRNDAATMDKFKSSGFFTEGVNDGNWKNQPRYFWTVGFWAGELRKLFAATDDPRYRALAATWTARLLGNGNKENHDAGFLNLYSSVLGYELSKNPEYKTGGLRAAARLKELFNPNIGLVSSWGPNGDDTIIDTMMNLQIWWWATRETGDPQWRVLGLKHSLRSADGLIKADGSVSQSVHYNPGDDRQEFTSSNILTSFPNETAMYAKAFTPAYQGYAAQELTKDPERAEMYRREGKRITQTLIDGYLSSEGVLRHGCGTRPHDGQLIYGDYYLLETLTRLIQ